MKLRVSYGTAIVLGLVNAKQDVWPTTAYLLWDTGCNGKCSFCVRANGNKSEVKLSRITWPEFALDDVTTRLSNDVFFSRICLQTSWNENQIDELKNICAKLCAIGKPVCVTLHPAQLKLAQQLLTEKVDRIGIGLDAASARSYNFHKGRSWDEDFANVMKLISNFPGKIGVHLIWGLGDSEEEFIWTIEKIFSAGGNVALFALTPPKRKFAITPPEIRSYRRIQIFAFLKKLGLISIANCHFYNGELKAIDKLQRLYHYLTDGEAFQTSGCPNCNRPFYNENPSGPWYNYPRRLTAQEAKNAILESDLINV